MSIYIRAFRSSDLAEFKPIEPMDVDEEFSPELAQAIEDSELAVTGIRNGRVVGCGGVHPTEGNDFHGEMWLRLSRDCQSFPIETMRWLKTGQKIIEENYPFKQLNATIKCCFKSSIKMIEYLGFTLTEKREHEGQNWLIYSKRVQE